MNQGRENYDKDGFDWFIKELCVIEDAASVRRFDLFMVYQIVSGDNPHRLGKVYFYRRLRTIKEIVMINRSGDLFLVGIRTLYKLSNYGLFRIEEG